MKKNKIVIVFSSHLGNEENNKFTQHIKQTIGIKNYKIICCENYNQYSLTDVYNNAIKKFNAKNVVMLFIHPDIIFKTRNWGKLLLNKFNNTNYSIIGVAGSTYLPESGVWWEDRTKMVGIVEHTDGYKDWVSEYSSEKKGQIMPVVLIDGLFMAVDCNNIEHQFDVDFKGFHHYDTSFCVPNWLAGCNIGVTTDIRILHKSVGQTNPQWEVNKKQLVDKYKKDLPIKYVSEDKLRVLICCQFFKNLTGSEMSNYELSRELIKLGCDVTIISTLVGEPLLSKAKKAGVNVYSLGNAPNYIVSKDNKLQFIKNEVDFDIIHLNHKPISEIILQMYPNIPAVMHVRSEVIPVYEEPVIHPIIKKYISIRDSVTEYIKGFGIDENLITHIDNPFDTSRFNTNYELIKNEKEIVLFIGTIDHLRKKIIIDLIENTKENNQELWIIGADNHNFIKTINEKHVSYFGIKENVEDYIKKCDYTAGIFKGRTTIEGFLCGKKSWVYEVDNDGNILNKELMDIPNNIEKYSASYSTKEIIKLYHNIINI
ncbi:MAG: glycosyltransferase [bacterium]